MMTSLASLKYDHSVTVGLMPDMPVGHGVHIAALDLEHLASTSTRMTRPAWTDEEATHDGTPPSSHSLQRPCYLLRNISGIALIFILTFF
jgi:hypothetical protein